MQTIENKLITRLLAREEPAMTEFYQRYHGALFKVARRLVHNRESAEDVVQESMVKIWFAMASYDVAQGRLFTWATRICHNAAIDHLRTRGVWMTAHSTSLHDAVAGQYVAVGGFSPEHVGVRELLLRLRPAHAQVLDLLYLQGYTQAEAAATLNVPLGTIKTWNGRALHLLAQRPL